MHVRMPGYQPYMSKRDQAVTVECHRQCPSSSNRVFDVAGNTVLVQPWEDLRPYRETIETRKYFWPGSRASGPNLRDRHYPWQDLGKLLVGLLIVRFHLRELGCVCVQAI